MSDTVPTTVAGLALVARPLVHTMYCHITSGGKPWQPGRCTCGFTAAVIAVEQEASDASLAEQAYWYFLMTTQGGPDGSELDEAVAEDMLEALRKWAAAKEDPGYLSALAAPPVAPVAAGTVERCAFVYNESNLNDGGPHPCNRTREGHFAGHPFTPTPPPTDDEAVP